MDDMLETRDQTQDAGPADAEAAPENTVGLEHFSATVDGQTLIDDPNLTTVATTTEQDPAADTDLAAVGTTTTDTLRPPTQRDQADGADPSQIRDATGRSIDNDGRGGGRNKTDGRDADGANSSSDPDKDKKRKGDKATKPKSYGREMYEASIHAAFGFFKAVGAGMILLRVAVDKSAQGTNLENRALHDLGEGLSRFKGLGATVIKALRRAESPQKTAGAETAAAEKVAQQTEDVPVEEETEEAAETED